MIKHKPFTFFKNSNVGMQMWWNGYYTTFVWFTKTPTIVIEHTRIQENYNTFTDRLVKLRLLGL